MVPGMPHFHCADMGSNISSYNQWKKTNFLNPALF